jgi:polysaccharide biosynthesis protein PslG
MPIRLAALLVLLLAALALATPARALTIGIADQKPDMFADPRFQASGIHYARRAVAWDALSSPGQTAVLDQWMAGARAAKVSPLISFTHSSTDRRQLPTPERLLYEFRRFRARYPWVTDFATWNEANHCGEPTCHRPALVASYWRKLRLECPTCRILAAEVLDMPNMTSWVKAFRGAAKIEPRYWGLHNYIDANRLRTTGTRRLLKATRGLIWFTETGGIVSRTNRRRVTFPESVSHAATATRFLFDDLVPLSLRITRVYVYHWNSEPGPTTWDSALIGPSGKARPAFRVLERVLTERHARPSRPGPDLPHTPGPG